MKYETNTLARGDSAEKVIDSQGILLWLTRFVRIQLKEQNHASAHAKDLILDRLSQSRSQSARTFWSAPRHGALE